MTTTTNRPADEPLRGGDVANSDRSGRDLLAWADEYVRRGWSIIALYHVEDDGSCSCGRPGCKAAGKHPRESGWQNGVSESPLRWQRSRANIGIRTGRASGHWVLDYDPESQDDAGYALWERLAAEGLAPHVRTGGGGFHWRFGLPDFEVRNRQSAGGGGGRTHRLPMGWDVRGEGGQVVAPPSVSAKGAYVELDRPDDDDPPAGWRPYTPPAWLLELVRPQVVDKSVDIGDPPGLMVSTAFGASPAKPPTGGGVAGSASDVVEESSRPTDQVTAYCKAALYGETDAYGALTDGRRSEIMAAFARRLVELANLARWPHDAVYPHFELAVNRATGNTDRGGYLPHEIPGQWERARAHVGDRAAIIPPRYDLLPPAPFPDADQGSAEMATLNIVDPSGGGGASHGVNGASPARAADTSTLAPNMPPPPAADPPCPPGIDPRTWLLVCAGERREHADAIRAWRKASGRPSLASEVLTGDTLDSVPDPAPLVEGWLFMDSLARINGRPGQGKSFVAADLLCSVATGGTWVGVPVRQGPVLAIVAEGVSGFKLRVRAWESDRGVKVGGALHLIPRPVQTLDAAAWAELVAYAVALRPVLITLDTQARISEGARENDSTDMGRVVAAVEALRRATGACVLLVHHAVKTGDAEGGRGSNAVEGATVSEFYVSKAGHTVTIKTTRQKDIESEAKATFNLVPVEKSAVLTHRMQIVDPNGGTEIWKEQARALYEIMRTARADGETWAAIRDTAKAHPVFAGRHLKFVSEAWNNLLLRGLVIQRNGTARFSVHVMETVGSAGVLTPNLGEHLQQDPSEWQTYAHDLINPNADFGVNLGKGGRLGK